MGEITIAMQVQAENAIPWKGEIQRLRGAPATSRRARGCKGDAMSDGVGKTGEVRKVGSAGVPSCRVEELLAFECPRFDDLPEMGLYLEQALAVVNQAMAPILTEPITKPMMSNYVKMGVVPPAVRKRYYREHLAYAIAMAIFKPVFTVEQVAQFYGVQKSTYPLDTAYNYVCREFENALHEAFAFTGDPLPSLETKRTRQTVLVRAMVLSAANHVFAEHYLADGTPQEK